MDIVRVWIESNPLLTAILGLATLSLWLMMPNPTRGTWTRAAGGFFGLLALFAGGFGLLESTGQPTTDFLFWIFSSVAIASGALMVTSQNPVYAALWFALATLSVCGMFLLGSAGFLAAATMIVYAGAIVVMFLFVIMLSQQQGLAFYDRWASRPLTVILVAMALLGGLINAIRPESREYHLPVTHAATSPELAAANPLSRADDSQISSIRGVGRSLFGDYLFAVEIAGTILMVAAIGAILIVPRRRRGDL